MDDVFDFSQPLPAAELELNAAWRRLAHFYLERGQDNAVAALRKAKAEVDALPRPKHGPWRIAPIPDAR